MPDLSVSSPPIAPSGPPAYADVVVPRRIGQALTYRIPPALHPLTRIGSLVLVPLGASRVAGLVVRLTSAPPRLPGRSAGSTRWRDILKVLDTPERLAIPPDLFELTRTVADQCLASWGQCLRLVLASALPPSPPKRAGAARHTRLAAEPASQRDAAPPSLPSLPSTWQIAIRAAVQEGASHALLLHAPFPDRLAGYLYAIETALAQDRAALIVTSDIAHVAAIVAQARHQWGETVAAWHSLLSPRDRAAVWARIRSGDTRIVVGTRSAIFAPLDRIGAICVDREEDHALKEEQAPRYHARTLAWLRAKAHGAALLLGSSHPSLESWTALEQGSGTERVLRAPTGPDARPSIHVVDLRQEPFDTLLSSAILDGMRAALTAKAGCLLFLNRKGFSAVLLCRDCGQTPRCPACATALTYFKRPLRLACHLCGTTQPIPEACPHCQAVRLHPVGAGTERLEDDVRRAFPDATILRLDRDLARTRSHADALRRRLAEGSWDIAIGTRMLFQTLDLPPVGFVGVPHADDGLHLADFRAAERTYHALVDAMSRARPAADGGLVIVQTHLPTHHTIAAIARQDEGLFYREESALRQTLGYPPYTALIALHVSGAQESDVERAAAKWGKLLASDGTGLTQAERAGVTILGPIAAPIAKRRGRYRWQLLVKAPEAEVARRLVRASLGELAKDKKLRSVKFDVDVDPLEMG